MPIFHDPTSGEVTLANERCDRLTHPTGWFNTAVLSSCPDGRHRNAGGDRRAFLFIEPRGLAAPADIMPPLRGWCFG